MDLCIPMLRVSRMAGTLQVAGAVPLELRHGHEPWMARGIRERADHGAAAIAGTPIAPFATLRADVRRREAAAKAWRPAIAHAGVVGGQASGRVEIPGGGGPCGASVGRDRSSRTARPKRGTPREMVGVIYQRGMNTAGVSS